MMASCSPASTNLETFDRPSAVRACASCSRAKAKCVAGQESNGKCQRCHRLKKICEPTTPQARTQPRKRRAKETVVKSRVGKLEEKVDGLVSLLSSTRNTYLSQPSFNGTTSANPSISSASLTASPTTLTGSQVQHISTQPSGETPNSQYPPPRQAPALTPSNGSSDSLFSSSFMPSFDEANDLIAVFRDHYTRYFPFIVLPPSTSAENLYQERPLFYFSILAVTSHNTVQQQGLGKVVMKQLAERVFEKGERNLDLLLGALTYASWCVYNCWNIPQVTSLISTARLARPCPPTSALTKSLFVEGLRYSCTLGLKSWTKTTSTLEEKRAFLGYYYLSSVVSMYLRRVDPPQLVTPYLEDSLKDIEKSDEHPNDKLAVALVRLQSLHERAHQTSWRKPQVPAEVNAGTVFIINSIEQELQQLRKTWTLQQAANATILLHSYIIEMSIYEAGLCIPASGIDPIPKAKRLELLCAGLQAAKFYFEVFLAIPPACYVMMSLASWAPLSYAFAFSSTLSNFEHEGWDLITVRETINYNLVLDCLIERLESLVTLPGFEKSEIFSCAAKMMKAVRTYVQTKMAASLQTGPGQETDQDLDLGAFVAAPDDMTDFFQFLDDAWMTDDMGSAFQFNPMTGR